MSQVFYYCARKDYIDFQVSSLHSGKARDLVFLVTHKKTTVSFLNYDEDFESGFVLKKHRKTNFFFQLFVFRKLNIFVCYL